MFPGLIIGIVVLMIVWIVVQSVINSMNVYTATGEDIRMTNPLYDRSQKGDRYELRGLEAIRKGRNSQIVNLTAPRLESVPIRAGPRRLRRRPVSMTTRAASLTSIRT